MFIRIAWGKLRPGAWEEYERYYYENIVPADGGFSGLRDRRLLRCAKNEDEGSSLTVWDTFEDLVNYENSDIHRTFAREVAHLYGGEFWVKSFEFDLGDQPTPFATYPDYLSSEIASR
jgi:heme-degrading monooxygenase HmoA